jgi:hypothetical protein
MRLGSSVDHMTVTEMRTQNPVAYLGEVIAGRKNSLDDL